MATMLSRTAIIFGVFMFYLISGMLLGMIPSGNASSTEIGQTLGETYKDFGSGEVSGAIYNATDNIYYGVSIYECADATGYTTFDNPNFRLFYYDDGSVMSACIVSNTEAEPTVSLWSFKRFTTNISELGWFNTLFLIPIIGLVAFMFATSSALYNMD